MALLSAARYAEAVLARTYHRYTAFEMAEDLRAALAACPKRIWCEMRLGYTYLRKLYSNAQEVFRLVNFTPLKSQATVFRRTSTGGERSEKIYRGAYASADLIELSPALITLLGVSHRDVLAAAITHGFLHEIPSIVRREEPDLFVPIPERFNTEAISRSNKRGGAERLRSSLCPQWGFPVTPATIEDVIDSTHEQIAAYQEEKFRATKLNPKLAADYDRYIADAQETIDWYRWVQTTVEEGGVFYADADADA